MAGRRSRRLASTKRRLIEVLDAPEKEEMTVGHLYILGSELINTSEVLIHYTPVLHLCKMSLERSSPQGEGEEE